MPFADLREKMKALIYFSKLKEIQFSIWVDFSKRAMSMRKNLWNSVVDEKKKGAKVKLMFEKIKINNIIYIWDGKNQKWYVCLGPSIKEYAQYLLKCHKF